MMGKYLPCLHQFYKELLAGERPSKDSQELAALLSPNVCMEDSNLPLETNEFIEPSSQAFHFHGSILTVDSHGMPHDSHSTTNGSQNDILLLQISLIQMMGSKLHSEILNQDVRESYMKATRVLLEDMDISSKLVPLFGCPDKLLSHMAVKCVASLILVQILVLNLSIESWMNSCLYTLSEDSGSSKAAEWLQTITFVTKEILKGKSLNKTVTIQKLLIPLDSVFDGFYSVTFASYSGDCRTSGATTRPDTENIATTNQLPFIDLLEVFAAIRIQLKLNFSCLRILYLCASQILHCVISSAHYLVKKRLLLLLKQCILCQAGEDDADSCCAISQQDNHMHYDLLAVSNAVLQALVSGWLRQVPVSPKPSFFGGSEIFGVEDSNCGPDLVTLRAVSLILIKAMEIKVQNMTFADKEKGCLRAELQSWMSQLMTFLRMHFQCPERSQLLSHPCTLVSLVFGEQDDDMVEAARALLNIYKRSYRSLDSYSQGKTDISLETHEHCFNPHCIFLLMLQNLAFDHCVLLDFLISTETCFLEYLVRYLRLLQEDWHPFHCICVQFDAAAESFCSPAINDIRDDLNLTASVERDRTNNQTVIGGSKEAVVSCTAPHLAPKGELRNSENNSGLLVSSNRPWPLEQPQSLVDYESSEDSDSDGMEAPYLNIVSLKGSQGNEEMNNTETPGEIVNHVPEKIGSINVVSGPRDASSHSCEKHTKMSFEGMFKKSMRCLTELRKTISRLQGRSLFPYNATALLKLLLDIETRSRKDSSNPA
ncbi:protein Lines homolog 1 isoform X1 [Carcharodon carcharias]|uniref:protein Lines homolog 1 isoform X1 n=1 Tax=Carcharodon carcharias TaxID=13397 RepID=UPI001B7EC5C8|nr:protein Lines homolog 1 isoform X1 [Carcharodon carcharias]XP_041031315.1 protein Lines homolog 1 isoform X1 [Carcharodon carcharias]